LKIVQLTPGAGTDFYCENCLRDSALVMALRALGHDVLMVPLYLPLVTEDADPSAGTPVFYGGINVFLQQKLGLFRKTPRWLDRLLDAPWLLRLAAKRAGMTHPEDLGATTLSMLQGRTGRQVKELDRLVGWLGSQERPQVVCLSNALLLGMARELKDRLGVAVVCLLQDEDTFLDTLPEPYRGRAWALVREGARSVDAFLAVSQYYAAVAHRRLAPPADRVHVVYPGIDLAGYEPREGPADPPAIGFLAQMGPDKGLDTLVEAFILLKSRGHVKDLKLRVAGGRTAAEEPFVRGLVGRLEASGCAGDVAFILNPDRAAKQAFLGTLSVLSVPEKQGEAFALYVLEALASGVPVVEPRLGVFPEILDLTGGGTLYEPGNVEALADALEALLLDPARARDMAAQGRRVVADRFRVERMAQDALRVFDKARSRFG
jgi:glycosyltransferase involved in cell wall biosynthesis